VLASNAGSLVPEAALQSVLVVEFLLGATDAATRCGCSAVLPLQDSTLTDDIGSTSLDLAMEWGSGKLVITGLAAGNLSALNVGSLEHMMITLNVEAD
jgi:hypothetical protein